MESGVELPVSSLTWERQGPPAASILQPTYRQAPVLSKTLLAVLQTQVLLPSSSAAKKHSIVGGSALLLLNVL